MVFCDLEGEDGLFDGPKGKPQFETYRCVGVRQAPRATPGAAVNPSAPHAPT